MTLVLRPWTVKKGIPFNFETHRRLRKVQGALWAVCVRDDAAVVGVALVGHPARKLMEEGRDHNLCVLRVAVIPGHKNACSMLYGACSRAAKAMGADGLVTYTHLDEHGTSLRASGWIEGALTDGGEWDRDERQRELAVDPNPKRPWWAPWSIRAKEIVARCVSESSSTSCDRGTETRAGASMPTRPRACNGSERSTATDE